MSQGSARRVSVASRLSFPRARAGDEVEKARRAGERMVLAMVIRLFMLVRVIEVVAPSKRKVDQTTSRNRGKLNDPSASRSKGHFPQTRDSSSTP